MNGYPFGTVVKPHGIRGELKVFCESDEPALLKKLSRNCAFSSHKPSNPRTETIQICRWPPILALDGNR